MDEELKDELTRIKNLILKTILKSEDLIKKWNRDENISFKKDIFEVLFHGDWSRNSKCKLNLDKYLDTTNKPSVIFLEIKKELQRSKTEGLYKSNFNPNLFFIFFEEFYNFRLKNTSDKTYNLIFDFLKDHETDKNISIRIKNRENLENNYVLRKEILRIIEFHSKILFDENLRKYLGDEIYCKIFIKNCVIQKKVLTYNDIRFIDLCYAFDTVILYPSIENNNLTLEELQKIESKNLYLEVNEEKHIMLSDKIRNNALVSTSGIRICNIDTTDIEDFYSINVYKNLIKVLCKIVFNHNLKIKNDIMRVYLVCIENLNNQFVNFIISYKYENKNFTIKDILDIIATTSNDKIKVRTIIKNLCYPELIAFIL